MRTLRSLSTLLSLALLAAAPASAAKLMLSTGTSATLPGLTFSDGDVALWDPVTATTVLAFSEGSFGGNSDIDAFHRFDDGTFLLSTSGNATLGALGFGDDDIVLYDPVADSASLFFDGGALFSNANEDVDAVSVLANGHLLLSASGGATLGGLGFSDGDIVEYDALNDVATLYFDESLFSGNEDVDGVHAMPNGTLLLSTTNDATLAGLSFGRDDVVLYDPFAGTALIFFDGGATFANAFEDVDALSVPEPALVALLMGPLWGALRRR